MIGAGARAYFAPYNIAIGSAVASTILGPTILDLQFNLPINTNSPPSGWFDCGWIKNFKITPGSKIGQVRSGYRGAVRAQYRGEVGETIDFSFREACRMQWKIATGTTPFNLLANQPSASTVGPLSASGAPKTSMVSYTPGSGMTQPTLVVGNNAVINAVVGSFIVADLDYNPTQSGIVGASGQPVFPGQIVDTDYVRKTSDFVARVVAVSGNTLTLDQNFVGGGSGNPTGPVQPPAGSNVQLITGWSAREGGTYITEWSGLFIIDMEDIAQIAIYYPHLSINQFKDIQAWTIENQGTTDQTGYDLDTTMTALAFDDPLDGETVVGYYGFIPAPGSNVSI